MDSKSYDQQSLVILNRIEEIPKAIDFFNDMIHQELLQAEDRKIWSVVIDEVLSNIIKHAYPAGGNRQIRIDLQVDAVHIQLVFSDDGRPFNPVEQEIKPISADEFTNNEGGAGLRLIRHFADVLDYQYQDGKNWLRVLRTKVQTD